MPLLERFAGWLVCGPLGHLVAGLTDVAVVLARHWSGRLRGRSGDASL